MRRPLGRAGQAHRVKSGNGESDIPRRREGLFPKRGCEDLSRCRGVGRRIEVGRFSVEATGGDLCWRDGSHPRRRPAFYVGFKMHRRDFGRSLQPINFSPSAATRKCLRWVGSGNEPAARNRTLGVHPGSGPSQCPRRVGSRPSPSPDGGSFICSSKEQ